MLGAVAVGTVLGAGGSQLLDDDAAPANPSTGGAASGAPQASAQAPAPAEPDSPPIQVEPPSDSTTREMRSTDPAPFDPTSALNGLHDLRVATQVIDDFPDASAGGRVGSAGWAVVPGGEGAGVAPSGGQEGGVVRFSTGSAATGRVGLHLGLDRMRGLPVFTMEWRVAWRPLEDDAPSAGAVFGFLDAVDRGGTAPAVGIYFLYRPDLADNWLCACAGSEGRTVVDTAVPVVGGFQRFQITSDGTSLCRFYVDDRRVGSIDTGLPTEDDRYGTGIEVFKIAGDKPQKVDLDWFFLRRELVR